MSAAHDVPEHQYHLVDPSPWPLMGAVSGFVLALGAAWMLHPDMIGESFAVLGAWKLLPGVALLLYTMYVWWRDVVVEAGRGDHTPVVQLGLRYGMAMFILSEVMFFAAFFWAFFDASLGVGSTAQFMRHEVTGGVWPPASIETFDAFHLPFVNTLILLLSGCTVTWAHHALREGHREQIIQGLTLTIILGVLFSVLQGYEYAHAAFGFSDGVYSSIFYMATGFHGFHVIIGTCFLTVCLLRARKGHFTPTQHFGFEAAAWYWHFVDVVWLFLFVCVYWWGG